MYIVLRFYEKCNSYSSDTIWDSHLFKLRFKNV